MTLQKIRRFTLIISMLLFPITIYYFSPYLIIMAAMRHIINGSFIVFSLMFILGLFFGRIWCGFFCPTGGMCECFAQISDKAPFMIFGYKVGRLLHLPQLKIKSKKENCIACKKCEKVCPMSLNVTQLLQKGEIKSAECILCGECVKACTKNVLEYKITSKR